MIVLDTETTGLLVPETANVFAQPHITELCMIKIDPDTFEIEEIFETFVKPPVPIEAFITKITGISDETVENSPTFIEIYDELCEFTLGETEVVGHNINFDMDVIRHELRRIGFQFNFPWPMTRIDTVEASYIIEKRRLKLGQLHEKATGKTHEGAHRAKADVIATIACLKWLKEEGFL